MKIRGFLGLLLVQIIQAVMNSLALKLLWNWFLVPLGVVQISFLHAVGIAMIISLLNSHTSLQEDDNEVLDWSDAMKSQIGIPIFAVIIGFTAYVLM